MFKKLCRVVKTLPPLIKLFSFNRKGFLQNLEKTEQGTSLQDKQGEQDEPYYRSLGKLAYRNMGLGGGG